MPGSDSFSRDAEENKTTAPPHPPPRLSGREQILIVSLSGSYYHYLFNLYA